MGRRPMIGISSLLLWAALSIDVASGGCYSEFDITLNADPSNAGWNGLGRGFLSIFTPSKLTDEHWQIVGKIYRENNYGLVKDLAMSMGGLVFLVVVAVLMIICFCAAPITLCVFSCTCKKKWKLGPKSQSNNIAYIGIGCNSLAMLTILLSILFCHLSLSSLTYGTLQYIADAVKPLPETIEGTATKFKNELKECGIKNLVSSLTKPLDELPFKISEQVVKIQSLKDVMEINFAEKIKTIDGFTADFDDLEAKIEAAKTKLNKPLDILQPPFDAQYTTAVKPIIDELEKAKTSIGDMKNKMSTEGSGSIKDKLRDVEEKQKKASKSEIENKIRTETAGTSSQIKKVSTDANKRIDDAFRNIDKLKKKVSSFTEKIIEFVDKAKDHLGSVQAINLVLLPCYLALASAIWSTAMVLSTKLVKKKAAKRREMTVFLIPLAIGIGLAFIPLLVATAFMAAAGVSNVVCSTVFDDSSFGFLPQALNTFNVNPIQNVSRFKVHIPTFIGVCRSKNLLQALQLENKLDPKLVIKQFKLEAKKTEMTNTLNRMSFGLPVDSDWSAIETTIGEITTKKDDAKGNIDEVAKQEIKPAELATAAGIPVNIIEMQEVNDLKDAVYVFIDKVDPFVEKCTTDIGTAKRLNEADIKSEMVKIVVLGDGNKPSLMNDLLTAIDTEFQTFRTSLIADFPGCRFIYPLIESVGNVFCVQALGGLNGAYAAIGLGVMSFFSATVGTVLIWHSFRAGRGPQEDEKTGGSGSKKNKKTGKVGEQATPKSDPTPQHITVTITHPNGVVQVTDPDKTNPSLLPNDALPADPNAPAAGAAPVIPESGGTPLPSNPFPEEPKMGGTTSAA